ARPPGSAATSTATSAECASGAGACGAFCARAARGQARRRAVNQARSMGGGHVSRSGPRTRRGEHGVRGDIIVTAQRPKVSAAMDRAVEPTRTAEPRYQSGFGNHFATEALPGALPVGRTSPQRCASGLYAEQFSGTAFTAPRHANRRSWLYRIRPAAVHGSFREVEAGHLGARFGEVAAAPNRL